MSDSSFNPFASPGHLTESAAEGTDRETIELRPVSFSGKLSEEEAHLLSGRKTINAIDFAFMGLVAVIVIGSLVLWSLFSVFPFGASPFVILFTIILWGFSRVRHKPYWWDENTEGVVSKQSIIIKFEGSEIHLTSFDQKIHVNSQGIRIDLGQQAMLRHFLISRHWFQPSEYEVVKSHIEHAVEPDSAELHSLIANRPDSAIPFYDCSLTTRILNHLKQSFGALFTAIIAISFIAFSVWISVNSAPDGVDFFNTVVMTIFSALGAFLLGLFFAVRAKTYFDQNRHVPPDPNTRKLIGWIDSSGFVYHAMNGVIKSRWDGQLHHTSFLDSLNLFCALADPWIIYLHPNLFRSRIDWQRAKKIIEMNTNSSLEAARKNRPSFLKLRTFSRVR